MHNISSSMYIRINCALEKESLEEGLKRLVDAFNYFYER
ncbi:hypothetical protein BN1326_140299 [Staphylococcus argenteus]|uniref:Uncharacterized protein n=1 Tax=Staphylococcus argenteus TaxID=985002 RepID=A0A7U7PWP4_9STAP|nr:hypothetical protein BN1326_140299 [Staphylococcus argenteus]CRI16725.1 hypothetical protein BN1326_140299 [Staphylococcus argenteus]